MEPTHFADEEVVLVLVLVLLLLVLLLLVDPALLLLLLLCCTSMLNTDDSPPPLPLVPLLPAAFASVALAASLGLAVGEWDAQVGGSGIWRGSVAVLGLMKSAWSHQKQQQRTSEESSRTDIVRRKRGAEGRDGEKSDATGRANLKSGAFR